VYQTLSKNDDSHTHIYKKIMKANYFQLGITHKNVD